MGEGEGIDVSPERDEDQQEVEAEEKEALGQESPAQQERAADLAQPAADAVKVVEESIEKSIQEAAQLPPQGAVNRLEQVPPGPGSDGLKEQVEALRAQVERIQARGDGQDKCKYLMVAAAIVTALTNVIAIYFTVKNNVSSKPPTLKQVDQATRQDLASPPGGPSGELLAAAWRNTSEASFWGNLALFARQNSPRPWDEQLMFCQYTEDIAIGLQVEGFVWGSAEDKVSMVAELASILAGEDGLAAMYERLPALRYRDQPLPRAVAANLGSLGLTQWRASQPSSASSMSIPGPLAGA